MLIRAITFAIIRPAATSISADIAITHPHGNVRWRRISTPHANPASDKD
jgi:hypothetical protein